MGFFEAIASHNLEAEKCHSLLSESWGPKELPNMKGQEETI